MSRGAVAAVVLVLLAGCTSLVRRRPGPRPGGFRPLPRRGVRRGPRHRSGGRRRRARRLPGRVRRLRGVLDPAGRRPLRAAGARGPRHGLAYVGGYRWAPTYGPRPCQIAVVDLRSGRVRTFVERFEAPVYGPDPTYCRHGGGLERTREGLWVAETERLWLLDPARLGKGDPVLRVWRLDKAVKGSTLAIARGRMVFGGYRSDAPGPAHRVPGERRARRRRRRPRGRRRRSDRRDPGAPRRRPGPAAGHHLRARRAVVQLVLHALRRAGGAGRDGAVRAGGRGRRVPSAATSGR